MHHRHHHLYSDVASRRSKKLTEYEKWEYKQLMMSGVLDPREYPLYDEENGMGVLAQVDEVRGERGWMRLWAIAGVAKHVRTVGACVILCVSNRGCSQPSVVRHSGDAKVALSGVQC